MVESYGVWAAHSLEVLRSIIKKSLLSSGLSLSQASRQFHEQLSVRLWQYNSRIISDRLDLMIVYYLPNYCDIATYSPFTLVFVTVPARCATVWFGFTSQCERRLNRTEPNQTVLSWLTSSYRATTVWFGSPVENRL